MLFGLFTILSIKDHTFKSINVSEIHGAKLLKVIKCMAAIENF